MSAGRAVLETPRLVLREFTEDDLPVYYELGSNPEVMRHLHFRMESLAHALETLRNTTLADYAKHGYGRLACVLKDTGAVIGFSGIKWLDEFGTPDLGYRFLPEHWGRGYATEAGREALRHAFEDRGFGQVIGLARAENAASINVLRKLGMVRESTAELFGERALKFSIRRRA